MIHQSSSFIIHHSIGTLVFVADDEKPKKVNLAEITGVHSHGSDELMYNLHYWYTLSGKKNSWRPAYIHHEDGSTVDAPRKNAARVDRDPWTGVQDAEDVIAAGFTRGTAHRALEKQPWTPIRQHIKVY
jgi:hypothetical protein